ncbi:glycerol-3-phosphate dehydrogenase [Bradyrhizobium betae]
MADYDLAIIGGGLNGVSLARDAAGRGLRVILLEQGDLGGAASSATPRMIHGDLSVLERRGFRRVHRALAERRTWLRIAPHLVRPMRFVIPAHSEERPSWLLRAGLFVYDSLTRSWRAACHCDPRHHTSSCRQCAEASVWHGFRIFGLRRRRFPPCGAHGTRRGRTRRGDPDRARCVRADRTDTWRLAVVDRGHRRAITARALANATGGWASMVAETVLRQPQPTMAAMQMSQIVVPRLFEHDHVYVFQNSDGRLIFASSFAHDFTLIGTVTHDFTGDPAIVTMPGADVRYLCDAASRYFRERVAPTDVVRAVSGVNLTLASARRRDGTTLFHARRRKAPLITMFGGDVTTSRLRAERAVTRLTPFYPMSPRWTAGAALPGGDFAWDRFDHEVELACDRWRFLGETRARRLVAAYGSRLSAVLGEAKTREELGLAFGPELTGAEVRYLIASEWARFPEDILWRRSKLGLTMPAADRDALAAFMASVT